VNLPLHVSLAVPAAAGPDPKADPAVSILAPQWPGPADETLQRAWASRFVALAAAKPFVRSITWLHLDDSTPHLYPNAGLTRPDRTARPVVEWLKGFRKQYLA
jgi:hypothetical protein